MRDEYMDDYKGRDSRETNDVEVWLLNDAEAYKTEHKVSRSPLPAHQGGAEPKVYMDHLIASGVDDIADFRKVDWDTVSDTITAYMEEDEC